MQYLPPSALSLLTLAAAVMWTVYARRTKRPYFAAMGVPFFYFAVVYLAFAVWEVSIETRQLFVRLGLSGISLVQAVVLALILLDRSRHVGK